MKRIVAVGGGELRGQGEINERIVSLVESNAFAEGKNKPYAVFLPQASHESKPYTNSFLRRFLNSSAKPTLYCIKTEK